MKRHLVWVLAFVAITANADMQIAKVVGFVPSSYAGKEILVFKLENNSTGGCNTTGRYVIDSSSLHFKATQASIVAAFHAQADVTVSYTQTCNLFPGVWDVSYVCTGAINC